MPRTAFGPIECERQCGLRCLQRRYKKCSELGSYGMKGSLLVVKTALVEKALPLSGLLRVSRELIR